ncbi:MAG: hypothetical protein P8L37_02410, partial [Phycisphaerales bacterium]|nr:hypothetical protein [Phycisphaerales bacterium]
LNGFHVHVDGAGDVETTCLGDVTGDAQVNVDDLLLLLQAWGTMNHDVDLDGDMVIGINDVLIVIGAWGPCE